MVVGPDSAASRELDASASGPLDARAPDSAPARTPVAMPEAQQFRNKLQRARAGDRDALEMLLAPHLPRLHTYLQRRTGARFRARESAEDLLQSTCREVLQDLQAFDDHGEGEDAFARWLYATAARKIVDRQRFHGRQRRDAGRELGALAHGEAQAWDLEQMLRTSATPSRDAQCEQRRHQLLAALGSLPAHYQLALRLAYFEGLSRAEMAERLHKPSTDAVQALLSRALARLALALALRGTGL